MYLVRVYLLWLCEISMYTSYMFRTLISITNPLLSKTSHKVSVLSSIVLFTISADNAEIFYNAVHHSICDVVFYSEMQYRKKRSAPYLYMDRYSRGILRV